MHCLDVKLPVGSTSGAVSTDSDDQEPMDTTAGGVSNVANDDGDDHDNDNPPPPKKRKPMCKYGDQCYQKNPDHWIKYAHPEPNEDATEVDNVSLQCMKCIGVCSVLCVCVCVCMCVCVCAHACMFSTACVHLCARLELCVCLSTLTCCQLCMSRHPPHCYLLLNTLQPLPSIFHQVKVYIDSSSVDCPEKLRRYIIA